MKHEAATIVIIGMIWILVFGIAVSIGDGMIVKSNDGKINYYISAMEKVSEKTGYPNLGVYTNDKITDNQLAKDAMTKAGIKYKDAYVIRDDVIRDEEEVVIHKILITYISNLNTDPVSVGNIYALYAVIN